MSPFSFGRILLGGLVVWNLAGRAASGQTASSPAHTSLSTKVRLAQAEAAREAKSYARAEKRFRAVLNVDPCNELAQQGLKQVVTSKSESDASPRPSATPDTKAVEQKLQSISIPFLEVYDMPFSDVLKLLRKDASLYDKDPDASARGLNIFLKLPSQAPTTAAPTDAGIPGLPPGAEMSSEHPPFPSARTRITVVLSDVLLLEALQTVASKAGLKVKVEPYAVSIVPLVEECGEMRTAELSVPLSFIGYSAEPPPSGTDDTLGRTELCGRIDAKSFLESSGVTFPPGSSAVYLRQKGKLIIRNTQANLDLVGAFTEDTAPSQTTPTP